MLNIRQAMLEALGMMDESVYDKLKFKAVMLAGGPGSGKSFILSRAFPEAVVSSGEVKRKPEGGPSEPTDGDRHEVYQGGGKWKVVNSDHIFTVGLLQTDLPLDIAQKDDPVTYGLQQSIRNTTKKKTAIRNIPWLNGMLPLILDGTCKDAEETLKRKEKLESLGYDVYMLFVDTQEEIASQRNAGRKRKVPDDLVRKVNVQARGNIEKFEDAFGENYLYVDNSPNWNKDPEGLKQLLGKLKTFRNKVENPKINNPIGQKIVQTLEANGGAYLADYFASGEEKGKSGGDISNLTKKSVDGEKGPDLDPNKGIDL